MAPSQRATKTKLSKMDQSHHLTEPLCLELSCSDEEPPEEVTFKDSKTKALRSVEQMLKSARREKELLKEKRKKRQQLFQEQKRKKLLSAELLEQIDASEKQSQQEIGDDPPEEEEIKDTKKRLWNSKKLKGNCKVTMAKSQESSTFQQQVAKDFFQSRLYGAGCHRTTSNQMLSLQNKTARNKGAAVDFVKSQWALEQKSKAEKLKLRWIHKHIPSS
ncbi:U3 small nucleolar RNA-associated protein NOL7 [Stigmatopora argus]